MGRPLSPSPVAWSSSVANSRFPCDGAHLASALPLRRRSPCVRAPGGPALRLAWCSAWTGALRGLVLRLAWCSAWTGSPLISSLTPRPLSLPVPALATDGEPKQRRHAGAGTVCAGRGRAAGRVSAAEVRQPGPDAAEAGRTRRAPLRAQSPDGARPFRCTAWIRPTTGYPQIPVLLGGIVGRLS